MYDAPIPAFSPPNLAIRDRAIPPEIIAAARTWPVVVDLDPSPDRPRLAGVFLRCGSCDQGVARLAWGTPEPGQYQPVQATAQDAEAGILRHVLQAHRPLVDPAWSGT